MCVNVYKLLSQHAEKSASCDNRNDSLIPHTIDDLYGSNLGE